MNEYIKHLNQDDAMISSSLHDVVMPASNHNTAENQPAERAGFATISSNGDSINIVPRVFSLNQNQCEITIDTGVSTLKKIQALLGNECSITFYDADCHLKLVEYQVDNANSMQMITTLKFFIVNDPN